MSGACLPNVVDDPFFFISFSYHDKYTTVLIVISISYLVFLVLIYVFLSFSLLLKFYLFSI